MKKTFAQSIICAILALSASPLTFAEVYNYVGKGPEYSLDDPNSWSPKGGSSGSYEWINGHTLIFDSNTNAGAALFSKQLRMSKPQIQMKTLQMAYIYLLKLGR